MKGRKSTDMKLCLSCFNKYEEGYAVCPRCGYAENTPVKEPQYLSPGMVLNHRYLLGTVIGAGGFGVTYGGWDEVLDQKVAIKEFLPGEFSTRMPGRTEVTVYGGEKTEQFEEGCQKFFEESRRLARLQKIPGIVQIYNSFIENGTAYIVMEYLEGETLGERLKREKKFTEEEAVRIILPVLQALEEVHKEGILHRDVAPNNIFLTKDGGVKLLDFGASRSVTGTHSKSLTVLYKEGFTPEEQYRSRGDQGAWTDVYAAAAVLYKMLTGIAPPGALERRRKDTLKEPSKAGAKVSHSVDMAVMNGLNVDIKGRTQSAGVFARELTTGNVRSHYTRTKEKKAGRIPVAVKAGAGIILGAMLLFLVLLFNGEMTANMESFSQFGIPEGSTRVPNIVNCDLETARAKTENANLQFLIMDKQFSTQIPENKILSQEVKAGSVIEAGQSLQVVVSAGINTLTAEELEEEGIELVEIPDVQYQDRDSTMTMLLEAGLNVEVEYETTGIVEGGKITQQSVPVGERLIKGDTITITVEDFVVDWTDASIFEEEVRKSLGKESGEIYASEMLKINKMIGIRPEFNTQYSVKPLTNCFNLQNLEISADYAEYERKNNIYLINTESLVNLVQLKSLRFFGINIEDISWINMMDKLVELSIFYTDVSELTAINSSATLEKLDITGTQVKELPSKMNVSGLEYLAASEEILNNIKNPSEYKSLTDIRLFSFRGEDVEILYEIPLLKKLALSSINVGDKNINLDFCRNIKNLESLDIESNGALFDFSSLDGLKGLKNLSIHGFWDNNKNVVDKILKDISRLIDLSSLEIGFTNAEVDLLGLIKEMKNLDELTINYTYNTTFTGWEGLDRIKKLKISMSNLVNTSNNRKVDPSTLQYAKSLEEITFYSVEDMDFNFLKELPHLKVLRYIDCPNITMNGLIQLTQLEELYINDLSKNKINELRTLQKSE
ncbi:PASTA domain-containing protein [Lachnospiraceae bacterium TF09-5]|nr:PASTA domain-containing protein [Lachnospiraceae bacterium TF09-5]